MFVKPVEGRLIRDPASRLPVPAEGRNVPEDAYWMRAVRDGDVIVAKAPAK
jgi:hypothetical protein